MIQNTATGQTLCAPCSLWISVSWRNRLDSQLGSLKVYSLNDSLSSLLFSLNNQENHREWVEQMTLRQKPQKTNGAGVREMAVVIKSIKESSKVRLEVTEFCWSKITLCWSKITLFPLEKVEVLCLPLVKSGDFFFFFFFWFFCSGFMDSLPRGTMLIELFFRYLGSHLSCLVLGLHFPPF